MQIVEFNPVVAAEPEATDANLRRSLPSEIACLIAADGNTDALETQMRVTGTPDRELVKRTLKRCEVAMNTADRGALIDELTALRLMTKQRDTDEADMAAATEVMMRELATWPADVAIGSIREAARSMVFFPSLAELVEICRERAQFRYNLIRGMAAILARH